MKEFTDEISFDANTSKSTGAGNSTGDNLTINPAAVKQITSAMLNSWSTIDTDGSKSITTPEINRAIADPAVKGDLALAVAAVEQVPIISWLAADERAGVSLEDIQALNRLSSRTDIKLPALTLVQDKQRIFDANADGDITQSEFDHARKHYVSGQDAAALSQVNFARIAGKDGKLTDEELARAIPAPLDVLRRVNLATTESKARLSMSSSNLFGKDPQSLPAADDIRQGSAEDCYLLAGLASLAAQDPQRLKEMFTEKEGKTVDVKFAELKGKAISVSEPTDTEIALYADSAKGKWPLYAELAFGKLRAETRKSQNVAPGQNIDRGHGFEAGRLLTGFRTFDSQFSKQSNEEVQSRLDFSLEHKLPIILSTDFPPTNSGLRTRHAYAVLGKNLETGNYKVMDPYRNMTVPQKDAADGKLDGIFEMSIDEMRKNFVMFTSYDRDQVKSGQL
ncbi:MAG: hypothetical protein HY986_07780 [Candidatus Melainabacteria bacterium]|nr:hypothetical protein [Candidatus Melainabacteria bacterium]